MPDGEVLARLSEGWTLRMNRGVLYFGIFLCHGRERLAINRPCFSRLRQAGLIRYVRPATAKLTPAGIKAAGEWRSQNPAGGAGEALAERAVG